MTSLPVLDYAVDDVGFSTHSFQGCMEYYKKITHVLVTNQVPQVLQPQI